MNELVKNHRFLMISGKQKLVNRLEFEAKFGDDYLIIMTISSYQTLKFRLSSNYGSFRDFGNSDKGDGFNTNIFILFGTQLTTWYSVTVR